MLSRVARLGALLECPRCAAASWSAQGDDRDGTLSCGNCGMACACRDGVLDLGDADQQRSVALERDGVRQTERRPELGGIGASFDDLSRASGDLQAAILALPYGDGSPFYETPGYFRNVRASVPAFDFLVRHLDPRPGERLLDVGADLTWAASQMARRGLDCAAVDINHHLSVGGLFAQHYGAPYHLVRADMTRVSFRPDTFDVVIAMSALHHAAPLAAAAANIARMLRPGGRLGCVEPYCTSAETKATFGQAQIDAGISEQTYLLEEWHAAFVQAGLRLRTLRVADSFAAVYEKRSGGSADPFERFYEGSLDAAVSATPPVVAPGSTFEVPLRLRNTGNAVWTSVSQFPVYASYHVRRRTPDGDTIVAFDNPRTRLPAELPPGETLAMALSVTAPAHPGTYAAQIDLVHEYVSWFADKGFRPAGLPFTVG